MSSEKSRASDKAGISTNEDENPPQYSIAVRRDPNSSLGQMNLRSDTGFEKTVTESFKLANSKGFLTKCSRCEGNVPSTTYHYGCPRCIAIATSICRKCQYQIPKCRIHQRDLIQRTLKDWPAAPPWVDYISATPTKFENPLIHALNAHDNSRTTIYASDPSLLNARAHLGYTPLHFAAHLGLVSGASILLSHGALTNIRDNKNLTPLLTAIELDQPQVAQLLLENGSNIHSVCGFRGTTALHAAAANGFTTLVSFLLEKGALIDIPSGRGTPLQLACRIGSVECASVLLEKGANPNTRSEGVFGEPPIITAVRNDDAGIVDLLVKYGADLDLTANDQEFTALSVAVAFGFPDMEKRLLQYGADVKTRTKQGAKSLPKSPALAL
jgi:ankyrin repeat protein